MNDLPSASLAGQQLAQYRIGERLGAGGMGEVYRAEDTRLGRVVALKVLHAGPTCPDERSRLFREARAASVLRSSNIATIYDLGQHGDRPFIVMELVDGEALSARLIRGPLPIPEAVSIAAQAADALDEAHGHGIIHRDVKSANLMVDGRGRVKLLDFGLAKYDERPTASSVTTGVLLETQPGVIMGTFTYMSPEQVRGRPLDARSDLFSLGVVLYEMLTGRLPFEGETATDVADRILNADPPAISRFNYAVPERLDAIVLKALAKDPAFRYQSARELYIDLHSVGRWLEDPTASRSTRRAPSGAIAAPTGEPRKDEAPAIAVMTFGNTSREPTDDWIGSGIAETVTADLRGARGITMIGRTQVHDAIKHLSGSSLERVAEHQAIEIGRRLGASYIVGGAYQRLGALIRITAELVDVRAATLVRTVKVDGRLDDLFALQDRLVDQLKTGLSVAVQASGPRACHETASLPAWEAFSRGQMNLRTATRDSLVAALMQFEQAIALDPNYASAWAHIGLTYSLQGQFLSMPALLVKATAALERALQIDPANVFALAGLASVRLAEGRSDEAIGAATRAVDLAPTNHAARSTRARAFWIGKGLIDEGIAALERARAHNPDAGYVFQQLALLRTIKGDLAGAEIDGERAVALQEGLKSGTEGLLMVGSHVRLGYVRYRQGRYDSALASYEREEAFLAEHDHALKGRLQIEILQKQGAAFWRKGDREGADRAFTDMLKAFRARQSSGADDPYTKYYVASLCALRGDAADALRYLAECVEVRPELTRIRARLDPDFDSLRADPAFRALVDDAVGARTRAAEAPAP
jgi:serine/threonine protein kinase/cytochrome c-type biogenesis protein CcmH/NrfG